MEAFNEGIGKSESGAASKPLRRGAVLFSAAILLLAFVTRFAALSLRLPHFDEGVNGWWVDEMTRTGYYQYDPGFFHGPLHFYVLFVFQALFGRHIWALRFPVAVISVGCVALALCWKRHVGERPSQIAALCMAASPGMIYYGRDAIHETEQVFFLMLAAWSGAAFFKRSPGARPSDAWLFALAIAGMVLTKETYAVHLLAALLAFPALWILERLSRSSAEEWTRPRWPERTDWIGPSAMCVGLIVFFYSGCFLRWESLPGLFEALARWGAVGFNNADHDKPWSYWFQLMWHDEWPALAGIGAIVFLLARNGDRLVRWLAIYACGALAAYSIIKYKTPWCFISMAWPFYVVLGAVVARARTLKTKLPAYAILAIVLIQSGTQAWILNAKRYADESEPYVYVQTTDAAHEFLDPIAWFVKEDPDHFHMPVHILVDESETHPLPWMLDDFTSLDYLDAKKAPAEMDAAFLLVDNSIVSDTEDRLKAPYYKRSFLLRGQSEVFVTAFFRATLFQSYFHDAPPEFEPRSGEAELVAP